MARPTRRGFGLCLTAFLLLLVGSNVQAGWLFGLSSLLLGAAVAGLLLPRGMTRGIAIERRAPDELFAGDDVSVDLVVTNKTPRTKLSIIVRDSFIAPVTGFVPLLGPREQAVIATRRPGARRGVIEGGSLEVSSDAPFGVAMATRKIAAPGRTVVFPRVVPVGELPALGSASKPLEEASVRARKGTGHDFLGIREYRPGDGLRHVHWRSTARHDTLMVREFEQELPRRLGILIDTWADTDATEETGNESALDACCAIAASIALDGMEAGHPVALAAVREGDMRIASGPDRKEALTWLAELKASGGPPLQAAVDEAISLLGRLDTLVLVFPTWRPNAPEALARTVADLDSAGIQVVGALVEVDSFDPGKKPAPRLGAAETKELSDALAAAGAAVYRFRAKEDLAACLQRPYAA